MIDLKSFFYGFLACGVLAAAVSRVAINNAYKSGYGDAAREITTRRDFNLDSPSNYTMEALQFHGHYPETPPKYQLP